MLVALYMASSTEVLANNICLRGNTKPAYAKESQHIKQQSDTIPTWKTAQYNPSSNDAENHRYVVQFQKNSHAYKIRLDNAIRKLSSSKSVSSKIVNMFLPRDNIEVITFTRKTEQEAEEWKDKPDVESVEKGERDDKIWRYCTSINH